MTTLDEALAKRQAVRSKTGVNPNAEFQAGWEAAMRALPTAKVRWGLQYPPDDRYATTQVTDMASESIARNVLATVLDLQHPATLVSRIERTTEWENA